ncbi:Hydroxymethylpyrimidine/phosphomethylpyrimidine kinase [Rickettsiales bacterium Ac37b]|nr:Hydroxymethylpyrimidine/phosphomethylpyrimidine kinase [Rickettsiales bacterium Ac37b]
MKKYIRALSIAGFDGSGGAGIQADLKTFSALGCYGMTVLTALPIQNTQGVQKCYSLPLSSIAEQITAIIEDIGVDVIKIGMLERTEIIEVIASSLRAYSPIKIICDPVMVSKNGERLIAKEAIIALKELIFPISNIITPNIFEAEEILNIKISSYDDMYKAAFDLLKLTNSVLLKGGHILQDALAKDILVLSKSESMWLEEERITTKNTHGTGCSLSAAIAAFFAHNSDLKLSVQQAKKYITKAIYHGSKYEIGHGHGPVHHFFNFWE